VPEDVPLAYPDTRSNVWFALEQCRALFELWQFTMVRPMLRLAPKGVGRPVLVLPGFLSDDYATATLRHYLWEQRHAVHPWHLGINLGPTEAIMDGVERRLNEIFAAHGEPVSLVGVATWCVRSSRLAALFGLSAVLRAASARCSMPCRLFM
jgi:hypothetical protein